MLRMMRLIIACVALLVTTAERTEASHLFTQFGNPAVQINAGQTATFEVHTQPQSVYGSSTRLITYFDNADFFQTGDIIQFNLGGFTTTYDFDNPGNITDTVGGFTGDFGSSFIFDYDAGSLLGHNIEGTNYTVSVLAGSVRIGGFDMADNGSIRAQHGSDTLVGVTNTAVPEPSSIVLLTIGAIGLIGYGYRRKRKQAV